MPTKLPIRPRLLRPLVFPNTCTCSFDLEQTSPSHSARWLHCSRCLPGALFTDRSRLPFVAVSALSPVRRTVGLRCRIAGQFDGKADEKKGQSGGKRIWGYKRAVGKKFPDEFSRRSNPGRRILTPVSRRWKKENRRKGTAGHEKEETREEKEKPLKRALRRLHFSRHLYGRLTLAIR